VLNEVLRLLAEGGVHSTAELARQLGVSEELVTAMAESLTRHGYLMRVGMDCVAACDGCALAGACAVPRSPMPVAQLLTLTTKGRQAVEAVPGI
jgi:DNA-binding MarR family transcriptional regulator